MNHLARAREVFDIELAALKKVYSKHEPIGLVDSQDLPKFKMM